MRHPRLTPFIQITFCRCFGFFLPTVQGWKVLRKIMALDSSPKTALKSNVLNHNNTCTKKPPNPARGTNQASTLTTSLEANPFCFVSTSLVFLKVQYIASASQGWIQCVFSPNTPQPSGKSVLLVCLFNFYLCLFKFWMHCKKYNTCEQPHHWTEL